MGTPQFTQSLTCNSVFPHSGREGEEVSQGDHSLKNAIEKQYGCSIMATFISSVPWKCISFKQFISQYTTMHLLFCLFFFSFPLLKWDDMHCRFLTQYLKKWELSHLNEETCLHRALYNFTPWTHEPDTHTQQKYLTSHVRGVSPYISLYVLLKSTLSLTGFPVFSHQIGLHWDEINGSNSQMHFPTISSQPLKYPTFFNIKKKNHTPTLGCVAQDFGAAEVPGDFCRDLTDFTEAKAPSREVSRGVLKQHRVCPAVCLPNFPGAGSSWRQEGTAGQPLTQ